jgi:HemY protein
MQRLIIFLLIFIASIFFGLKIAEDPGFAFFSYKQWSAEMPLWFALLAIVITFFLVFILLRIINGLGFSMYRFRNWRKWRLKYKAYSKTNRGLIEMIEGNWKHAERDLMEGISQSDAPLVNYLAAAKAAHEQGAFEKRDAYLREAHQVAPHSEVAIGITQATLLINQGQILQAQASLDNLLLHAPRHRVVLKLLERVYVHQGDWQALLKLLPQLQKTKIITAEEFQNFEKRIYLELLNATANQPLPAVQAVWENIPRKSRQTPAVIAAYVKQIMRFPETANIQEELLAKALKTDWDLELVKLYGLVQSPYPVKQLSKAERWLKDYPEQPILLLTVGRLSMRCQLWGKARTYLENSLKYAPVPEAFVEYGKLLELLGDETAAARNYRSGILLTQ